MSNKFLVINAGSSSLKFSLYLMPEETEIVNGYIEKIGKEKSICTLKYNGKKIKYEEKIENHIESVKVMLRDLLKNNFINDINEIKGIGHRVLHGGEYYSDSILIDNDVLDNIKKLTKFGPLHHPGEIAGIESMQKILPNVPQIAVFDTAFHQTMPQENYIYAVPYSWYNKDGVRKYGFHGTSHKYITETMKERFNKDDINLIICHIGSGASISCIKNGICYDTTMGLTPLDGVVMGTRSGSIDPSIIEYICNEKKMSVQEVLTKLNNNSGLIGVAGKNDFRDLENDAKNGDEKSILAIKLLENSIIKYIAQYFFELEGKLDALVFTAGIGENAINLRKNIVNKISKPMNITLNEQANNSIAGVKEIQKGKISSDDSNFEILVEPTNEEIMILRDTYKIVNNYLNNKKLELNNMII